MSLPFTVSAGRDRGTAPREADQLPAVSAVSVSQHFVNAAGRHTASAARISANNVNLFLTKSSWSESDISTFTPSRMNSWHPRAKSPTSTSLSFIDAVGISVTPHSCTGVIANGPPPTNSPDPPLTPADASYSDLLSSADCQSVGCIRIPSAMASARNVVVIPRSTCSATYVPPATSVLLEPGLSLYLTTPRPVVCRMPEISPAAALPTTTCSSSFRSTPYRNRAS